MALGWNGLGLKDQKPPDVKRTSKETPEIQWKNPRRVQGFRVQRA